MYDVSVNIGFIDQSIIKACVIGENPMDYARYDVTNTWLLYQLVKKNKGIIEAGWESNEIGFPMANCNVIKNMFSFYLFSSMEYFSFTLKVRVGELS